MLIFFLPSLYYFGKFLDYGIPVPKNYAYFIVIAYLPSWRGIVFASFEASFCYFGIEMKYSVTGINITSGLLLFKEIFGESVIWQQITM